METDIRKTELAVLSLEDSVLDFEIIVECLKRAGYQLDVLRVETEADYINALQTKRYDVILSDFSLPTFDAFAALALSTELCSEVPFICVSGMIGEEKAIELIKKGAIDYILKDRLARLPSAVQRALDEAKDKLERRISKEELLKSEEKFRTVANYTTDWEFWIDENDNYVYCSPSCEGITGCTAQEFLNNSLLDYEIVHPDDLEMFQFHKLNETNMLKACDEFEYRIVKADGAVRWIGHVCQPIINQAGDFMGIRGGNRDITERKNTENLLKNSERKYKLVSENIIDGIFILKSAVFEFVNPAMSSIFGYEFSELRLMNPFDLFCASKAPYLEEFLSKNHNKDDLRTLEIECVKKDNTIVLVEIILHYVLNEQAMYGVVHDITEKKQIQKKNMVKAIIQTEEKERAYFAKELHDGIGPLLSTIKLYLQWTQKIKNIEQRDEIILKAEEILEDTLTSVKEISYKLSPHILEYHGLTSAIQNFSTKVEAANPIRITLQSNVHRRLEMEIEVALYRAVIECVNNSLKYSKAKNIYIQINDTGHKLLLQYRDDGQGFDLDKMISEQKGLGLFNLQNRLSSIGGEITMFSKPGLGVDYHFVVMLEEK